MEKNELGISFESANPDRSAFRVSLPGLTARFPSGETFAVKDLSSTGIGLACTKPMPPSDKTIAIDLYVSGRLYLAKLSGQLVRGGTSGLVAFTFIDIDQRQGERLDRLILSMQKQLIKLRKIRGE